MQDNSQVVSFAFSPNISWKVTGKIVEPLISKDVWDKFIRNKPASILMPGYFLEVLTTLMATKVLKDNGANITSWITPTYYNDLLKFFNIKIDCCKKNESPIKEYERLLEPVNSYPVPVFSNGNGELFFNLLHNYGGHRKNINGKLQERIEKPYWKQILCNTCSNYNNVSFPKFNKEDLFKSKTLLFKEKNINCKYILIDNSNLLQTTSDNRKVKNKIFTQAEIDDLAYRFIKHKIKCIVMSNEDKVYVSNNVSTIRSWNNINSLQLLSLFLNAECIVSSDQNICLSSALLGCRKIIYLDNPIKGWRFEDLPVVNKDNIWNTPNFYSNDLVYNIAIKEI